MGTAFNQPPDLLCLIFSGKIMKDEESLTQHKLQDGFSVHLVIKSSASRGPQEPPRQPTSNLMNEGQNNNGR